MSRHRDAGWILQRLVRQAVLAREWQPKRTPPVRFKQSSSAPKPSPRPQPFVDSKIVRFQGGKGGDGCISSLNLFANANVCPDGGNGGCGGHVVLRANQYVKSLNGIASAYLGKPGVVGMGKNLYGANAEHTFVDVPVGTVVAHAPAKHLSEEERPDPLTTSDIVADLDEDGSMFIAARGGGGGRGNNTYLSNTNRHPQVAQRGAHGEVNQYELRIRVYAHVALIGLPNAGKSTLLNSMTSSNSRVGEYPFTTTQPFVGVLEYPDYSQVAISDLPGLIDESHLNRGLGIRFLRHVQRCVCLLYVVDLSDDPIRQLTTLFNELEAFKKGLSHRDHMIVANKIDKPGAANNLAALKDFVAKERPDTKLLTVSAKTGDNLELLRLDLKDMYDRYLAKHADDPKEALVWVR